MQFCLLRHVLITCLQVRKVNLLPVAVNWKQIHYLKIIDYIILLMILTRKSDEAILIGKLLAKIFSNSLARIINYSGSGSIKLKLQNTNILTVIEYAIIKKISSCDVTEVQSKLCDGSPQVIKESWILKVFF